MPSTGTNALAFDASDPFVPPSNRSGGIVSVDNDRQVETSADVLESLVRQIEQLEVAVDHRTTIGQAQGILMERLGVDADTAFEYLKRVSMDSNRKLVEIADQIAQTRELPRHQSGGGRRGPLVDRPGPRSPEPSGGPKT